MSEAQHAVGIDLGTTHCALASVVLGSSSDKGEQAAHAGAPCLRHLAAGADDAAVFVDQL